MSLSRSMVNVIVYIVMILTDIYKLNLFSDYSERKESFWAAIT